MVCRGSERQTFAAFHYDPCYAQEYAVNQWLASTGRSTVISVNYRSGTGYGHAFRNCKGCMGNGAKEYDDIRQAAIELARRAEVDSGRIGVWGLSYGGLNVLQAIARDSALFAAGVSIAGMFNWISASRYTTDTGNPMYNGEVQPAFSNGGWRSLPTGPMPHLATPDWSSTVNAYLSTAFESSPVSSVSKMTSPLLLVQGDADEEVDFEELIGCVRALRLHGIEPEVMVVPDEVHGLGRYSNQMKAYAVMTTFFDRHLNMSLRVLQ